MLPYPVVRFLLPNFVLWAGLMAPGVAAQPSNAEVRRLSPEQKESILRGSDGSATDAFLSAARGGGASSQIHGEVGAMVGSGGSRGIFGTTHVPLGERGSATFFIEKSEYGQMRPARRRAR